MNFTKTNLFKTIAIAVIFCMMATTGAFAASTQNNNRKAELVALTQLGITDATSMTDSELEKIQGEWGVYGAVAGGFAGAIGYTSYAYGSRSAWSWRGFTTATSIGAATGFIGGPLSVGRTLATWGVSGGGSYAGGRWSRW